MRRRLLLLLAGGLLATLTLLALASWQALQVKRDLTEAQTLANGVQRELTRGDAQRAQATLPALQVLLTRAADRTTGRVWGLAERVPIAGDSFRAVRRTTTAAQVLGEEVLPEATAALDLVRRRTLISNGRVDLAALAELDAQVQQAAAASAQARRLLAPTGGRVLPVVRDKVAEGRRRVAEVDDALTAAHQALTLAPTMLGRDGPRRYFIAVQNNAEARATGGLIGAFALVTTDRGQVTLTRTGTDSELGIAPAPVPSDPKAAQLWKDLGSTQAWYAANLTPHFPDVARNLAGQWAAQTRQRLDGVIALDPLVMGELLQATGPVSLPDGTAVTDSNVIDFVGHDEYVRYPDVPRRKELLRVLAATLFGQVLAAKDPVRTLQALGRAGTSGHLYVWSRDAKDQALLGEGLVSGRLPTTNTPYLSVLTQNYGGNKLDYYLRRTVAVRPEEDGRLRVTVTLRNTAPAGLPAYMTVRSDRPNPPVRYGQAKVGLAVYGALSSEISGVEVDGPQATMTFDRDHGHRFGTLTVEVPRDREVVVSLLISQPKGTLSYRQQPLVVADALAVDVPHRVLGR